MVSGTFGRPMRKTSFDWVTAGAFSLPSPPTPFEPPDPPVCPPVPWEVPAELTGFLSSPPLPELAYQMPTPTIRTTATAAAITIWSCADSFFPPGATAGTGAVCG